MFSIEFSIGKRPSVHEEHALGRKRLLDTLLAATYWAAGVESLLTTNAPDFRIFDVFKVVAFDA